jgi:hypothetical protein
MHYFPFDNSIQITVVTKFTITALWARMLSILYAVAIWTNNLEGSEKLLDTLECIFRYKIHPTVLGWKENKRRNWSVTPMPGNGHILFLHFCPVRRARFEKLSGCQVNTTFPMIISSMPCSWIVTHCVLRCKCIKDNHVTKIYVLPSLRISMKTPN